MTTDDFTTAAIEVAQSRWPVVETWSEKLKEGFYGKRAEFRAGAAWARDHLAVQEPTDAPLPESVVNLIRDLTDEGDCWFDHGGGCQEHGYLSLTPEQECPHSEAKRLLAAHDSREEPTR